MNIGDASLELIALNKELSYQNEEKEKRAAELLIANKELAFQNEEKQKRSDELILANKELAFQNEEKEKRAAELLIANKELAFQNEEKEKRAYELHLANKELSFQNDEKERRAYELYLANKELAFQNEEKQKRSDELILANKELAFQNEEKEKRAAELIIANHELLVQNEEKRLTGEQIQFDRYNLSALINNTTDLMWSVDTNFNLITSNKPFDDLIQQLIGAPIKIGDGILNAGFPETQLIKFKTLYERALSGETFTVTEHDKSARGWFEVSYRPIRNRDEIIGIACHSRDITVSKRAELERIKITNELIQRNKDLEQFTYIVSHNLRAPVANILGAINLFNEVNLNADEKAIIGRGISESVARLDEVVNDLNRILQVNRDINETKEIISFSHLVDDITISIKNLVDKDDIEIQCDFSETDSFLTLKSYLHSIFYNLISNSLKYHNYDVPCIIHIKSRVLTDTVQLVFTDNGTGIDLEKNSDEIFGLYKQFHANKDGKGMGLFMVKTQVEALGGRISIKSEINKGTEFTIEFPAGT